MNFLFFGIRVFLAFLFGALVIMQTDRFWISVLIYFIFAIIMTAIEFLLEAYSSSLF